MRKSSSSCFKKHLFLPQDHGSWALLLSPLLIGLLTAPHFNRASASVIVEAFAVFLLRQPLTILVKIHSGRRPRRDRAAALCWTLIYGLVALLAALDLVRLGYVQMLWLGIPAALVFVWHLYLVSRRAERRQMGVEIVATGTLSLTAAAAFWAGSGAYSVNLLLLWLLVWLQAAASIVYTYLRLEQRVLPEAPENAVDWKMGARALLYTSFNLGLTLALGLLHIVHPLLGFAFLAQWLETLWGITHPAVGKKPTYLGIRQVFVTAAFTVLFILFWR